VPEPGTLSEADKTIIAATDALLEQAREAMKTQQLHLVLQAIWSVVADANQYFASSAPWELKKTDPAKMAAVLWTTAEVVRQIAILAQPFVPAGSSQLLDLLAVPETARDFSSLGEKGRLKAGTPLPAPSGIFPRYVDAEEEKKG
jgi:methionyl-tRNA synthetase